MGTFTFADSYIDDWANAARGFPVTSTATTYGRFQVFFAHRGRAIRVRVEQGSSETFSSNGPALPQTSHQVSTFDEVAGTETDIGIRIHA